MHTRILDLAAFNVLDVFLFLAEAPEIPNYTPYETHMTLGSKETPCVQCRKGFHISHLLDKFSHPICDTCYEEDKDKFPLITKTAAKSKYVLRDGDFERDGTALKFIVRTNPHNPRWGQMKLFLESQVGQI